MRFDRVIIADWSAASARTPARPSADAIWLGSIDATSAQSSYHRSRADAEAALVAAIKRAVAGGDSLLIGCDFPMGYPKGFAARLTGVARASSVWAWLARQIKDGADNRNNRFEVAAAINRHFAAAASPAPFSSSPSSSGPFWGRPAQLNLPDLPATKSITYKALGLSERRDVEAIIPRAQPVWKLYTTGAAGSQGLIGQPMIHRLSHLPHVAVWPFDPPAQITLAEVYPSLIASAVAADPGAIKDEAQVRLLAKALFTLSQRGQLGALLDAPACAEEGWILGAAQIDLLQAALR
ncbi:hypothetical protein GCM10010873_24960 [Cypionkella aquatica]|uniref:Molybdopterin guanine dinucleotide synthesis n=1 Tax=Cypionkella aquatica TaxID=1756042 RepID=A0AA37U0A0_9RHOB|nr:molybdopterin guanine dinucleotide synthesis [Cypionkella aquatica]GLS87522.1 hypothetical protein GCM10010873_24960 [Cypionkella aquatica]